MKVDTKLSNNGRKVRGQAEFKVVEVSKERDESPKIANSEEQENYLELLGTLDGSKVYYTIQDALEHFSTNKDIDTISELSRYFTVNYLCGYALVGYERTGDLAKALGVADEGIIQKVLNKVLGKHPTKFKKYKHWEDFKEKAL